MQIKTPNKILLIMIKDMGDVILTGPMAEVLKYNFPKAQVDILTSPVCAPVLEHAPFVDNIILYDDIVTTGETMRAVRDLFVDDHVVFPLVAIRNKGNGN